MTQEYNQAENETNTFVRERNSSDSTTDGEFLVSISNVESPSTTTHGRKRTSFSFDSSGSMSSETMEESISVPAEKKRRKSTSSGPSSKFRGVCRNRRKWQAVIWVHGKRKYLGTFKDVRSVV